MTKNIAITHTRFLLSPTWGMGAILLWCSMGAYAQTDYVQLKLYLQKYTTSSPVLYIKGVSAVYNKKNSEPVIQSDFVYYKERQAACYESDEQLFIIKPNINVMVFKKDKIVFLNHKQAEDSKKSKDKTNDTPLGGAGGLNILDEIGKVIAQCTLIQQENGNIRFAVVYKPSSQWERAWIDFDANGNILKLEMHLPTMDDEDMYKQIIEYTQISYERELEENYLDESRLIQKTGTTYRLTEAYKNYTLKILDDESTF
jgi:hypothetical protein